METIHTYLLDANVFIEAHRRYYAFDLCPGFWESIVWNHAQKRIYSIDRVLLELREGEDELSEWAVNPLPSGFFLSTSEQTVINWFGQMQSWAQSQGQFSDEAKAEFAAKADCWLIAYAKANEHIVVTHEEIAPDVSKRIPIPNVCHAFDVNYVNTFEMLRDLNVNFIWKEER